MAKLISDFCCVLQNEPAVLAITLFFIFCAIGGTFMMGLNGRRRLWKDKVEKDAFEKFSDKLDITLARLETRVWQLGTKEKQERPPQHVLDLANNSK